MARPSGMVSTAVASPGLVPTGDLPAIRENTYESHPVGGDVPAGRCLACPRNWVIFSDNYSGGDACETGSRTPSGGASSHAGRTGGTDQSKATLKSTVPPVNWALVKSTLPPP